jgi:hypothetical protein
VDHCGNYRPISLLCVAYKLLAAMILKRLQDAGAEKRLSTTQFGFRSQQGTTDAIFAARRRIELAMAHKFGRVSILALDWQRAFDCICPEALVVALRRFGVPEALASFICNIYADRRFGVIGKEGVSEEKQQRAGISQGCPLSPFLFVMMMTVVMEDAVAKLSPKIGSSMQQATWQLCCMLTTLCSWVCKLAGCRIFLMLLLT